MGNKKERTSTFARPAPCRLVYRYLSCPLTTIVSGGALEPTDEGVSVGVDVVKQPREGGVIMIKIVHRIFSIKPNYVLFGLVVRRLLVSNSHRRRVFHTNRSIFICILFLLRLRGHESDLPHLPANFGRPKLTCMYVGRNTKVSNHVTDRQVDKIALKMRLRRSNAYSRKGHTHAVERSAP